jgi:threonine/homoserine/homoserine lactone efflux protein
MLGIHHFGVFLASCILLNITPGPDTFYILGRTMAQGRAAGIASALGISAGSIIHTVAAALGLSAILAASATAFLAVKLIGAAYLIYLGGQLLFSRGTGVVIPTGFSSTTFRAAFRQGLITNVLNPKVALFFLAFMPQFVSPDASAKFTALLVLGLCFVFTGTIWCMVLAWCASFLGARLRGNPVVATVINRTVGALFIALGVQLATSK